MGDGTAVGALVTMALAGLFLDLVVTLVALLTLGVDWFLGALLVSKYYAEWSQVSTGHTRKPVGRHFLDGP